MRNTESVKIENEDDVTLVSFMDRKIIDDQRVQWLGEQLLDLIEVGARKIILSFEGVEYLCSMFIGKLITFEMKMKNLEVPGKIVLCDVGPDIYQNFEITRLNKFFTIVKDAQQALELLGVLGEAQ